MMDALLLGALAITVPVCYHALATMLMPGAGLVKQYARLFIVLVGLCATSWVLGAALIWLLSIVGL